MPNYEALPEHLQAGMKRYVEHGIETGSFLRAALENDFTSAVLRCDVMADGWILYHLARFLRDELPDEAWGSHAKVEAWIARHREKLEAS